MNYILRHNGPDLPDADVIKKVLGDNDITILDSSSLPKMALVDGIADTDLPNVKRQLPEGWELFPERTSAYKVPDTRQKVFQKRKK